MPGKKPTVKVKLSINDKGWRELRKKMAQLTRGEAYARTGVLGGSKDARAGDSITNVELAMVHEFGAPQAGIPERSFLRSAFDANREKYVRMLANGIRKVYEGKLTLRQVLEIMGQQMVKDVKGGITRGSGIPPPLDPKTIARKGSSRPLVDTGRLLGSITYEVKVDE